MSGEAVARSFASAIEDILNEADLASVSSKSIRKELIARFPHREEEVKTHKDEINTAIMTAYHRAAETGSAADVKPDVKPDVPATSQDEMPPSSMPLAQKPTKPKAAAPARRGGVAPQAEAETDEEYARRLHEELNSFSATRTTRNGATSSRSKASSSSSQKKRPKKGTSSAYVDSSDDDSVEPAKKKRRSTAKSGGGGGGGWQKPYALSPALADIVGASQMSRPQITKQLWVYIKAHDLQDPSDKRNIIPDERLRQVFNMNKISSFRMAKEIGPHLSPLDPADIVESSPAVKEEDMIKAEEEVEDDDD